MQPIDLIIIFAYLIGLFIFAIWIGRKANLDDFLVGGRKFKTFFLIFTMLSTMVGLTELLATASASYATGISFGLMMLIAVSLSYAFIWLFAKKIKEFGDKTKAHTMGDYLAYRYSQRTRIIAGIALVVAYFIFFAGLVLGLSQLLVVFGGQSLTISLIFALIGVIIYTMIAGVKSDFYTDVIHFFVMAITLIIVLPLIVIKSGGVQSILAALPKEHLNPYNFGGPMFFWAGILFATPIFLMCMEIWQRIYASNDAKTVNKTILWTAILTIPFIALAIIIGLVARNSLPGINPDFAFYELIKILPSGILGLAIAGIIAAILSTLNSVIMVISAIFTKDFYISTRKKKHPKKSYLTIGRWSVLVVAAVGLLIAYLFPDLVDLAVAANEGLIVLAPAIIGGFFWKKATEKGAFWSILSGFIILWGSYPFLGKMSFLPACIVSIGAFVVLSLWGKKK